MGGGQENAALNIPQMFMQIVSVAKKSRRVRIDA